MKRGTAAKVILGKDTLMDVPAGIVFGTDVILGGKAGLINDFNGLVLSNNVLLGKKISHSTIISVIVRGQSPLILPDAIADSLTYVKAFGGTEQRDIPDNYLQRQFIYMMDGSYLLTDIVPTYDGRIEMDFQTTTFTSYASFLGGRSQTNQGAGLNIGYLNNEWLVDGFTTGSRYNSGVAPATNTRYKFIFNNQVATLTSGNSTLFTNTFAGTESNGAALAINGFNNNGPVVNNNNGIYLYSFKAWDNQGNLIADYVPAVEKGTVPVVGFYDTVSKTFKTATAGTFAAGGEAVPTPDTPMDIVSNNGALKVRHQSGLPLGYTQVEYIKKTSLAYIDSGISQTDSVGVSIDVKFDNYDTGTAYQYALGAYSNGDYIGVWKATNSTVLLCFVSAIITVSSSDNTNFHNFKINYLNSRIFSYDDSEVGNINQTKRATAPSIYIGDTNYSQHFGNSSFSIKRVRISNETDIVFDGIPAKTTINGTEVVGLYDMVSGTFKTATSGTFTAGDPVSDPVEIYTDGTVETINVHGKNLFNKNNLPERIYAYFANHN